MCSILTHKFSFFRHHLSKCDFFFLHKSVYCRCQKEKQLKTTTPKKGRTCSYIENWHQIILLLWCHYMKNGTLFDLKITCVIVATFWPRGVGSIPVWGGGSFNKGKEGGGRVWLGLVHHSLAYYIFIHCRWYVNKWQYMNFWYITSFLNWVRF